MLAAAVVSAPEPVARPVIFSGPSVRAVLAGVKTQTRRLVKPQPKGNTPGTYADLYNKGPEWAFWLPDNRMTEPRTWRCPYGVPGGRLWVRERWGVVEGGGVFQATDGFEDLLPEESAGVLDGGAWRSPIFLPRSLSRILLEVTAVRIERLQAITEEDARAEGAPAEFQVDLATFVHGRGPLPVEHRLGFKHGWDDLHRGKVGEAWKDDPWVWVITFRRLP